MSHASSSSPISPARLTRRRFVAGTAAAATWGLAACGGGTESSSTGALRAKPSAGSAQTPDAQPLHAGGGALELRQLTAHEARAALAAGHLSAERLVAACLAQVARWERHYNAFTWLNPQARGQARAIDQRRRRGEAVGPLAGLPVVIKETVDHREAPSTLGWHRLRSSSGGIDVHPTQHAEVVRRLLAADAIIIGKGNVPAFSDDGTRAASSWAGPTYNAVARTLAPGASSSGVATAVAAGFALLGVGEETGGSIQNPCGAQSLVGLTPTYGCVPTAGVAPLAGSTRDVVGPIARCVRDAALLMDVLAPERAPAGGWEAAALAGVPLAGRRVGLYGAGWRHDAMSAETAAGYQAALQGLAGSGLVLVNDPFAGSGFADLALPGEPYDYRGTESAAHDLNHYLKGLGMSGLAELKARVGVTPFEEGQPLNWYAQALPALQASLAHPEVAPDLAPFAALRSAYRARFLGVMDGQGLDAMVLPQRLQPLPGVASTEFIVESSVSALNIAGLPGLTLPAGRLGGNGSPFGLIVIGRPGSEAALFALGARLASALPARVLADLQSA